MSTTPVYTQIPPTSDLNYWQAKKAEPGQYRCMLFIPKDPELHLRLKTEAWQKIQAKLSYNLRSKKLYAGTVPNAQLNSRKTH